MSTPAASIIMRSFNEGWALKETLPALRAQEMKEWELIVIDSGSTDGSQELIRAAQPAHFIQIQPHEYNPGRVMNQGMRLAQSERCIFLNADATPQGSGWLHPLVNGLNAPNTAAVFGRQIPRPDCRAVFAHDYDRCFGPQRESAIWDHFFSMVSSGLRKEVWSLRGFREDLQYAEDDEYTRWCKAQGYEVHYIGASVAMHSHNYTAEQAYKRSFGDAKAIGQAAPDGSAHRENWTKTVLMGFAKDAWHDASYCLRKQLLTELPHAIQIRWKQRRGKLDGYRTGYAEAHP